MPATSDISVYSGDDYALSVSIVNAGVAVDISSHTGWQAEWRSSRASPTSVAFVVTVTNATLGQLTVSMAKELTATITPGGVWDIQAVIGGLTTTLLTGSVAWQQDVTR